MHTIRVLKAIFSARSFELRRPRSQRHGLRDALAGGERPLCVRVPMHGLYKAQHNVKLYHLVITELQSPERLN